MRKKETNPIPFGALGHTYLSIKVIFKKYLSQLKNLRATYKPDENLKTGTFNIESH